MQPTIVGTRAWTLYYGQRNRVETVNGQLQGKFINIDEGYVHLLDSGRVDGLLAYGLAGYNRWSIRNWRRDHRLLAPDDPDALPPETATRRPRSNRRKRFEGLPVRGNSPPTRA
jgi:hypothetical protein